MILHETPATSKLEQVATIRGGGDLLALSTIPNRITNTKKEHTPMATATSNARTNGQVEAPDLDHNPTTSELHELYGLSESVYTTAIANGVLSPVGKRDRRFVLDHRAVVALFAEGRISSARHRKGESLERTVQVEAGRQRQQLAIAQLEAERAIDASVSEDATPPPAEAPAERRPTPAPAEPEAQVNETAIVDAVLELRSLGGMIAMLPDAHQRKAMTDQLAKAREAVQAIWT